MKIVVPCAGQSSRMQYIPKHLMTVGGLPLLQQAIRPWNDGTNTFIFVLRRSMIYLWEYLPPKSIVVFQDDPKGLADALLQTERCMCPEEQFVVTLGDCLYRGKLEALSTSLGVGVWKTTNLTETQKSYLVYYKGQRITQLIEKPTIAPLHEPYPYLCGMGVYYLSTSVFDYIRKYDGEPGGGDLTHVLQTMIEDDYPFSPVWFRGKYINIGSPEDLKGAEDVLAT